MGQPPAGTAYADTTLVTRFDVPDRQTHLMVVNLDYRKARTIHVAAPVALERFNVLTGIWLPVGSTQADLVLPKGGGGLLRFAKPHESCLGRGDFRSPK